MIFLWIIHILLTLKTMSEFRHHFSRLDKMEGMTLVMTLAMLNGFLAAMTSSTLFLQKGFPYLIGVLIGSGIGIIGALPFGLGVMINGMISAWMGAMMGIMFIPIFSNQEWAKNLFFIFDYIISFLLLKLLIKKTIFIQVSFINSNHLKRIMLMLKRKF